MPKTRIMYVENKSGSLNGPARIGRVMFSKTGKSISYGGRTFQSLKGSGMLGPSEKLARCKTTAETAKRRRCGHLTDCANVYRLANLCPVFDLEGVPSNSFSPLPSLSIR